MTREHYYIYIRDKKGKLTGYTVCVLLRNGRIFHGVSNCSKEDQFEYAKGRKLALERAERAFEQYLERNKLRSGAV